MTLSELRIKMDRVFQSQTLTDRVYAELMRRNLISEGYQWKMFCKPNYERNAMVISIYIAKQTKIEVDINFRAITEAASMPSGKYELERYVLDKIIAELDVVRQCEDLCNKYGYHGDILSTFINAFELMDKETMNNNEEENKMAKTQNEIEFENFVKERQAQAEVELQAYKTEVENEIEAKRQECMEADKKDRAYQASAQYRYFYDGLIAAGFDESQAMAILLEKCEVTRFDMKG